MRSFYTRTSHVRRRNVSSKSHCIAPYRPYAFQSKWKAFPHAAQGPTGLLEIQHEQRRFKSVSQVAVDDLPQGVLDIKPVEKDVEQKVYPTVVRQAKENMDNNPGCVLLTRVGGFYELYLEHAEKYGPLLGLKVARKKTTPGPVAMAGFPYFQLDRYLKMLVQDLNVSVALSEEFANNSSEKVKSGGLLFDRRVNRIVSAGTLIDESFMDPYEHNYLLSIYVPCTSEDAREVDSLGTLSSEKLQISDSEEDNLLGLAWTDLSTGDFFVQTCGLSSISSVITSIGPREIIINTVQESYSEPIENFLRDRQHNLVRFSSSDKYASLESWTPALESPLPENAAQQFNPMEVAAGARLLEYSSSHLQGLNIKLQSPERRQNSDNMEIDRSTMRALEIKETITERTFKGSLLHAVRRTATKSGARLLSNRLASPSASLPVINHRLDLVSFFLENKYLQEDVTALLSRTTDSQRLVQKFSLGRGDSDDLLSLCRTIKYTEQIVNALFTSEPKISAQSNLLPTFNLEQPIALAQRINDAIDEEGLMEIHAIEDNEAAELTSLANNIAAASSDIKTSSSPSVRQRIATSSSRPNRGTLNPIRSVDNEVWIMKKGASQNLTNLHESLESLISQRDTLAESLRTKLDALSLTLRWTPGLGHICHVKGKDAKVSLSAVPEARSVSSSKSTRSFYLPEWTSLGGKLDQARFRIRAEEQNIFRHLEREVVLNLIHLRRNAAALDELDVACSSATLARELNLVRPTMNLGKAQNVIGGRHPTVDEGLQEQGRSFTPNDCILSKDANMWLITGPNMGGKSTFLRQNALLYVLAQSGQYVPAKFAEIGIIDKLFTRVGSADNLSNDQSTFMLEMAETAAILNGATERSFVIMDEVGRGTTPEDGIAISYAALHHLHNKIKCRTLFATHYHSISNMLKDIKEIVCYCTRVNVEKNGSFIFDYRIQPGVNRESHALKTAKLAGIPSSVIEVASKVLAEQNG